MAKRAVAGAADVKEVQDFARFVTLDPYLDRGEVLAQQRAEIAAQPADAGELEDVGQLVKDDPIDERGGLRVKVLDRRAEIGRDEQQTRGCLRLDQRQLELAEHAL